MRVTIKSLQERITQLLKDKESLTSELRLKKETLDHEVSDFKQFRSDLGSVLRGVLNPWSHEYHSVPSKQDLLIAVAERVKFIEKHEASEMQCMRENDRLWHLIGVLTGDPAVEPREITGKDALADATQE